MAEEKILKDEILKDKQLDDVAGGGMLSSINENEIIKKQTIVMRPLVKDDSVLEKDLKPIIDSIKIFRPA